MRIETPTESARWRLVACSEAPASCRASASCYRFSKDVGVLAVVVAELELCQVERQILFADVVEAAHDATLKERPKRFKIVGMHFAAHVLACAMADRFVRIAERGQVAVSAMLIRSDQIDFLANCSADEAVERGSVRVLNNLANDVALPTNRTNDANLAAPDTARDVALPVPVAILVLATDEGFINFDDSHKLPEVRIVHGRSQAMAHIPSCLVCFASDLSLKLERADALLTIENLPENLKPDGQGIFGIFEDGFDGHGKSIGRVATHFADPIEGLPVEFADFFVPASWATNHAVRPAMIHEELFASRFVGKGLDQLFERHHG